MSTRGSWLALELTPDQRAELVASDDTFDAFVCALTACAAMAKATTLPRPEQEDLARDEGWIHVPRPDSFEDLAP
jgi:hypothetical protein